MTSPGTNIRTSESPQSLLAQKRMNAYDAVKLVKDGETVVLPCGAGEPPLLLRTISEHRREFKNVSIAQLLQFLPFDYIDASTVDNIRHVAYMLGECTRAGAQAGWVDILPCHFSELPRMLRRGDLPVDVVLSIASPMDEEGYFHLSMAPDYTLAAIERAHTVVLESSSQCPTTYGDCRVHISQVTAVVESDSPMPRLPSPPMGEVERTIGQYVADLVPDGATLQIGWGGIPNAVMADLMHKKDLGIHSEMIGDSILPLIEAGVINGSRKTIDRGKIIGTFAAGSPALYKFIDRNPMVEMHPCDYVNMPYVAGQNDNLISINASLQVDLLGQCGSESLGARPFSGSGGQFDFVRAANISNGGKAIIVLPATAKGGTQSRIYSTLPAGTHVTTLKNDVGYIVSEFGVAKLRGKTLRERALAMISIAHPDFRDELKHQAKTLNLI